jgi:hypothetical protein
VEVPSLSQFQSAAGWPKTADAVNWWKEVLPDSKGHLEGLPSFVQGKAHFSFLHTLGVDPRCMHMWLCFFGGVMNGMTAVIIAY